MGKYTRQYHCPFPVPLATESKRNIIKNKNTMMTANEIQMTHSRNFSSRKDTLLYRQRQWSSKTTLR